jgi:hypothetical protein
MDGEPAMVAERGLLATSDEVWNLAVRRAEVIGRLAQTGVVGLEAADAAAAELGVSRRLVYVLLRRWREGEGVVSDLIPRRSSGGRGREHLPDAAQPPAFLLGGRHARGQRRGGHLVQRRAQLGHQPQPGRGRQVGQLAAEPLDVCSQERHSVCVHAAQADHLHPALSTDVTVEPVFCSIPTGTRTWAPTPTSR